MKDFAHVCDRSKNYVSKKIYLDEFVFGIYIAKLQKRWDMLKHANLTIDREGTLDSFCVMLRRAV